MAAQLHADVLVVGSGIAGLTAALRAARSATVLLVTKADLAQGATRSAQGGIAAALGPADSPDQHARDTRAAGVGLCEDEAVRVLCGEGPEAIAELIDRGVRFDGAEGPGGAYALCLEGAHGRPRILHAGGDATGRAIQRALGAAAQQEARIVVREHTAVVDLLVEGGRVVGAELMAADGSHLRARAAAVLLATGGAGQLFSRTTNPRVATGDGIAAAWRAGAALEDLEFYQFHPTALARPGSFLVSEAVRGEGAVLRDEHGRRFLPEVDRRAELAPRDVVARAIAQVMTAQEGRSVWLDATALGQRHLRERFPTIDAALRAAGIDWAREPVPITPAAHFMMGGIRTDLDGRSSLPGLLAAGECARTGVHGANRLASNSLLEGAVFGARAADAAAADAAAADAAATGVAAADVVAADVAAAGTVLASAPSPTGWTRTQLQGLMWDRVGLLRTGAELEAAAAQLATWQPPGPETLTTITALEDRNLLDLARLLTAHALARPVSVGAHHRLDSPSEVLAC